LEQATLDETIQKYESAMLLTYSKAQVKFFLDIKTPILQDHTKEAVVLMNLGLPVKMTDSVTVLNEQLMFLKDDIIYPIDPLARRTLINFYTPSSLQTRIHDLARAVFKHPETVNASVRGSVLKHYILYILEEEKKFTIELSTINLKKPCINWATLTLDIPSFSVHRFLGDKPPAAKYFLADSWILFIPELVNYKDVDFVFWNGYKKELWAFQITIMNPITDHSNNIAELRSDGCHRLLWVTKAKTTEAKFHFCWIGTNNTITEKFSQFDKQHIALIPKSFNQAFALLSEFTI